MMTDKEAIEELRSMADGIRKADSTGMNSLLNPQVVSCSAADMKTEIRFEAQDWEKNQRGEIHGGGVSAMFDTAMGMTVLVYSEPRNISTADLNVSFIRPFLGKSFIFRSEIIHAGRSLVRVRSVAYDEDTGKCLASGTSNFVHISR